MNNGPLDEVVAKAGTLLEALPYIQKFRGATMVVKYGGSFMDSPDPQVREGVARDLVFLEAVGINPVVVHGGGKAISRAMEEAGWQPEFSQGMRITDEQTVRLVDRVLSSQINPEIVQMIKNLGGRARGLPGTEVFLCRKFYLEGQTGPVDIGFVGEVEQVAIEPLRRCTRAGITPIVSPTARNEKGDLYNCNADTAAAKAAIALEAKRLIFMSDVPGVLARPDDPSSVISHLRIEDVARLKEDKVIERGMLPKVDAAIAAVRAGVEKVFFIDGRVPHALLLEIFTDRGIGTEIVA